MKTKIDIQIPSVYTGMIINLPDLGFCQDGVKHGIILHGQPTIVRIKGRNPKAQKDIEHWANVGNSFVPITVTGYPVTGAECNHVSVFDVDSTEDFNKKHGGDIQDG